MEEESLAQSFMAVKERGWGEGSQQGAEAYRSQSPAGATEAGLLQSMGSDMTQQLNNNNMIQQSYSWAYILRKP